jgi:hypothetical protein
MRHGKRENGDIINSLRQYTVKENNMITNKKYLDRVIAAKIGRTVKAIQVQRGRLNKFLKI